jgi:hypothetical protein
MDGKEQLGFSSGSYPDGAIALCIWRIDSNGVKKEEVEIIAGCKDALLPIIIRSGEGEIDKTPLWAANMGFGAFFDMIGKAVADMRNNHCGHCGKPFSQEES